MAKKKEPKQTPAEQQESTLKRWLKQITEKSVSMAVTSFMNGTKRGVAIFNSRHSLRTAQSGRLRRFSGVNRTSMFRVLTFRRMALY